MIKAPHAPIPGIAVLSHQQQTVVGHVTAGLGCPNGCDFCCTSHFFKRRYQRFLDSGREIYEALLATRKRAQALFTTLRPLLPLARVTAKHGPTVAVRHSAAALHSDLMRLTGAETVGEGGGDREADEATRPTVYKRVGDTRQPELFSESSGNRLAELMPLGPPRETFDHHDLVTRSHE